MAVMSRRRRGSAERPRTGGIPAEAFAAALVGLAVLIVFLPSIGNDFVNFDDDRNFLLNPHFRGFSAENLTWMSTNFQLGHFHPLTWYSLALDYSLWGLNPIGYHLTNALLHAGSAILLFLIGKRLLAAALPERPKQDILWGSVVGALLFALHPLRVESVAWASERRDVLAGFFYFLTVLLYLRGRRVGAFACFAGALMSKILVASLPVALLLVDLYPLRRSLSWRLLTEKIPFFALSLAAGLYTVGRFGDGAASGTFADIDVSPLLRLTLSLFALAFYLWKSVFPLGLAAQYVHTVDPTPLTPVFAVGAAAFLALAILAYVRRRRWPGLGVGLTIFAITLLPVLSFLRLDPQQYVADHHSYLAVAGLCVLLGGWWTASGWTRNRKALAAAVLLGLAALTMRQAGFWHDSESLWQRTLAISPNSVVAHNNLGRVLAGRGDAKGATQHFETALAVLPGYYHARYNLANVRMAAGDLAGAEEDLRRVLSAASSFAQARAELANCLLRQQRLREAETEYKRALADQPDFADAHFNYALLLEFQRRLDEAREHYSEAARLDPSNAAARQKLNNL